MTFYVCHCVILYRDKPHPCELGATSDAPFCGACQDRHPDLHGTRLGDATVTITTRAAIAR